MDFLEGLFGLILLVLTIWASIDVISSPAKSVTAKILWILFFIVLPAVGLIVYFLVGRKERSAPMT